MRSNNTVFVICPDSLQGANERTQSEQHRGVEWDIVPVGWSRMS